MRTITRATTGAALGLVLTAGGLVPAAQASQSDAELPTIPGATAEAPIADSTTSVYKVQGATGGGSRDGLRLFATSQSSPAVQVTSTVEDGTLEVVDSDGDVLCEATSTDYRPNLYECDLVSVPSGPQVITAAVVRGDGSYSTPGQAALDAYIVAPTIDSVTRKGAGVAVSGTGNAGATIQLSFDAESNDRKVVQEVRVGDDGTWSTVVAGGSQEEFVLARAVNRDLPPETPFYDSFTESGWRIAEIGGFVPGIGEGTEEPGEGTEEPGDGSGGGTEEPGEGTEEPGDGGEIVDPGEGGEGGEQPGEGGEQAGFTVDLADGDVVDRTAGEITLTGTGQPGGAVVVQHGSDWLGMAEIGADGRWTLTAPLTAGIVYPFAFDYYSDIDGQKTSTEHRTVSIHDTESDA